MNSLGLGLPSSGAEGTLSLRLPPQSCLGAHGKGQMRGHGGRDKHYMETAGGSLFFKLSWARHAGGESLEGLEQGGWRVGDTGIVQEAPKGRHRQTWSGGWGRVLPPCKL